jgi:DNA-binding CsgD family transcriptional regulator
MSKDKYLQFDFSDDEETIGQKSKAFDQMLLLPIDPLQEKYALDRIVLTEGELEILPMVLSGYSILEIALKINLSTPGVKFRLGQLYYKFGVVNRLGLIKISSGTGLQFFSKNNIKQTFSNKLNMRIFDDEKLDSL